MKVLLEKGLIGIFLILIIILSSQLSNASTIGFTINPSDEWASFDGDDWVLGFSFIVNNPITVTELGVYDYMNDGLIDSHQVALFSSDGNVLSQITINAGTSGTLSNNFRFGSTNPVALEQGDIYYIGAYYPSSNSSDWSLSDPYAHAFESFNIASQITFEDRRYEVEWDGTGDLPFPQLLGDPGMDFGYGYFGPNFKFTATPETGTTIVPEPTTMLLFGLGLLGLARVSRRKNISIVFFFSMIFFNFTTPANSSIITLTDRTAYQNAGSILQTNDFEEFNNWGDSYPGNPWYSDGITYNSQENVILGMGINIYPSSRFLYNNYWATPLQADIDRNPQYDMFSFDLAFAIFNATENTHYEDVDYTVYTNLNPYSFTINVRSVSYTPTFNGFIATEGEYFTGFEVKGRGTTYGMIDNVSLGQTPVPEPATMFFLGLGLLGAAGVCRRKNTNKVL